MSIIQRRFSLFLNKNICCDPSLEPSHRDGSNGGSQNMFLWRNMVIIPKLSLLPLLTWSTEITLTCSFDSLKSTEQM